MSYPASLMSTAASASPSMSTVPPYGLAMRFRVTVAEINLGLWSGCKGLEVKLAVKKVTSGGDYSTEQILPEQVSYSNIKLQRAVHPTDSITVKNWLQEKVTQWMNWSGSGDIYPGGTATITLYGAQGTKVMEWDLTGVYPVSWSGPELEANKKDVAIETLELAHQGFLTRTSGTSL